MSVSSDIRARIAQIGRYGAQVSCDEIMELDKEIDGLVFTIKCAGDLAMAHESLMELGELQELLALLAFKYDVPLSPKQKALVRGFDRPDDAGLRLRVFRAVKEGRFPEDYRSEVGL